MQLVAQDRDAFVPEIDLEGQAEGSISATEVDPGIWDDGMDLGARSDLPFRGETKQVNHARRVSRSREPGPKLDDAKVMLVTGSRRGGRVDPALNKPLFPGGPERVEILRRKFPDVNVKEVGVEEAPKAVGDYIAVSVREKQSPEIRASAEAEAPDRAEERLVTWPETNPGAWAWNIAGLPAAPGHGSGFPSARPHVGQTR